METKLLLSDEICISENDYKERERLLLEINHLPIDFFSKLRHFQPQMGCLNSCVICSKNADQRISQWTNSRTRNVVAAIKYAVLKYKKEMPYIIWDRDEHRSGVVFPYLDNDIGNYIHLDDFVKIVYSELGVKTRISTVGYSRYNNLLNDMHRRMNTPEIIEALAGVRLSFTPYAIGWNDKNSINFSREEYMNDMANFLSIYHPYYKKDGSGMRKMCVELRYRPLIGICDVYVSKIIGHLLIRAGNYIYVSQKRELQLVESKIADPCDHKISLTEDPEYFYEIDDLILGDSLCNIKECVENIISSNFYGYKLVEVYLFKNEDGIYYSINPKLTESGNYGINIYPCTEKRKVSGYVITERFFLNALAEYKLIKGISIQESFDNAVWEDVDNVINVCRNQAVKYQHKGQIEKAEYIKNEILPMVTIYKDALKQAGYQAKDFFDPQFTIDTGIICNLGRAICEFKGLVTVENEPLTPCHERNYGRYNSTMTQEGSAWRLSCNHDNTIIIEKLNLKNTSTRKGQVEYCKVIQLSDKCDEEYFGRNLLSEYLVPGQRKR